MLMNMSSVVRRRSREPGLPAEIAVQDFAMSRHRDQPPRKKTSTTTLLFAVVITLLIAALLLVLRSPRQQIFRYLPGAQDEFESTAPPASFRLHPEDHATRNATTLTYEWRVTKSQRRPDGVLKQVYLINDAFPGPTIEARSGDQLVIHVENALPDDEGLSIHWHGLSMRGANDMDGAGGITQEPVPSRSTFTYNFTIEPEQHGTFWFHSHFAEQRADGLYGGVVVHKPSMDADATEFDTEHLLLIGDWYHRTAAEALEFYMHPGAFGLETVPDSILVNGRGTYECSDAVPARPLDCVDVQRSAIQSLDLDVSQRSVLRIVNVGAYAGFSLAIPGATLTPLTVDGDHEVKGAASKSIGFIHPGERVSVLVEQNPVVTHYQTELTVTLDDDTFKYQNPALTSTHYFPAKWLGGFKKRSEERKTVFEKFDFQDVSAAKDQSSILPGKADETIVLYTLTQKLAHLENEPHGFINHTSWLPQSPPLIGLPREQWDKHQFVPHIAYDESSPLWVDIVLNNLDEDSHPFHLHGNDFWVISRYSSSYNWGSYNPFEDDEPPGGKYDLANAVKRDTFYVPRRGYAVLRFRADNPGLWNFHCHVLWHQASGMSMAFEIS